MNFPEDQARVSFLCSKLKDRDVNPLSFDSKVKFWSDFIEDFCRVNNRLSFKLKDVEEAVRHLEDNVQTFRPLCLEQVAEVTESKLKTKQNYEQHLTWSSWTMSMITSPVRGLSKLSPLRTSFVQTYIHEDAVVTVSEKIEKLWRDEIEKDISLKVLSIDEAKELLNLKNPQDLIFFSKLREKVFFDEKTEVARIDLAPLKGDEVWPALRKSIKEQISKVERLEKEISEKESLLKHKIRHKVDKTLLLKILKTKKNIEKSRDQAFGLQLKLESLLENYRESSRNKEVFAVMSSANQKIKEVLKMSPEAVLDLMDEIIETAEDVAEVNEALARDMTPREDEDLLEKELDDLLADDKTENLDDLLNNLTVSDTTSPRAPDERTQSNPVLLL